MRGVGEVPIVPPLAAVANAIHDALGQRFYEPADVAAEGAGGAGAGVSARADRHSALPTIAYSGLAFRFERNPL